MLHRNVTEHTLHKRDTVAEPLILKTIAPDTANFTTNVRNVNYNNMSKYKQRHFVY